MTERDPSDIERAARAVDDLVESAAEWGHGECARGLKACAHEIRALPPSPLAEENARLIAALAECFRLSGAEPGSDDEWTLAARAVDAVRRLREDYDEVDPIAEVERRLGRAYEAYQRADEAHEAGGDPVTFEVDQELDQAYAAIRAAREASDD